MRPTVFTAGPGDVSFEGNYGVYRRPKKRPEGVVLVGTVVQKVYGVRFVRLEGGQEQYVATHGTTLSDVGPAYPTERKPPPPRRIPDRELQKARKTLSESARRFLERCEMAGLLSESQVAASLKSLGIGVGSV